MFARIRARLTYANVLASVALFIALGGTGVAAPLTDPVAKLGSNVKQALKIGKQAKRQAQKADRNSRKALIAARIANDNALEAAGQRGSRGPAGPAGSRGSQGSQGDNGSRGATGAKGPTGPAGTTVLARITSSAPATSDVEPAFTGIALSAPGWTQPGEMSALVLAQATFDPPTDCGTGTGTVRVLMDGRVVTTITLSGASPKTSGAGTAFEADAGAIRLVTARVSDTCTTGQHFTLNSLKITVAGLG